MGQKAVCCNNPKSLKVSGNYTFTWSGRQLVGAVYGSNTYSFTYNENGYRISKTTNGTTTTYYYDEGKLIAEKTNGNVTVYLYDSASSSEDTAINYVDKYDPNPYSRPGEKSKIEKIETNQDIKIHGNREIIEEMVKPPSLNHIHHQKKDIKSISVWMRKLIFLEGLYELVENTKMDGLLQ